MSLTETPPTSEPPQAARVPFWRSVGQALRGEHHDYTTERLERSVLLLAVPMVLEMVMESLFVVADVFWVSRLGEGAVAVVGITEGVMAIIYAMAIGISMAGTALVARRVGEKDLEGAARAAGQVLVVGALISVALGAVLAPLAGPVLRLMGGSESLVANGTPFAALMLGGNLTVFLLFLINAVFRGAGDAVIAMRTLWLANAFNIALGPCFIFGWGPFPELGLLGAAVATTIGRGLGVVYQLWHLFRPGGTIQLRPRHFRLEREGFFTVIRLGVPGVVQFMVNTASWIGLLKIVAFFGDTALAAYTIVARIVMFVLMPAWGLSNAAATLVGQNLGAKRPDRAEAAVWIATRYNAWFLGGITLFFLAAAPWLLHAFAQGPAVLGYAVLGLRVISLAFPFFGAGMCLSATFNGAGDTRTPTLLNLFAFWGFEIPLAWVLATHFGMGPLGVFISTPVAFVALTIASWYLFRRGKWKLEKV